MIRMWCPVRLVAMFFSKKKPKKNVHGEYQDKTRRSHPLLTTTWKHNFQRVHGHPGEERRRRGEEGGGGAVTMVSCMTVVVWPSYLEFLTCRDKACWLRSDQADPDISCTTRRELFGELHEGWATSYPMLSCGIVCYHILLLTWSTWRGRGCHFLAAHVS